MISARRLVLLENATADGAGEGRAWSGVGPGSLQIVGVWDGATVTIKGSLDGGKTYTAPTGSAFTADAMVTFEMGEGLVNATISGAGGSTDLSAYLVPPERP